MKKRGNIKFPSLFSKTKKRGISPVIATVLLIALVVVIALIIFFWFRSMVKEEGTKFGKNIKLVCEDIEIEASYSDGLYISNTGNVPVFSMKIKTFDAGERETRDIKDIASTWPENGLRQGMVFSEELSASIGSPDKIILIPVLIGSTEQGEKTFECDEKQGYEIISQ